MVRTINFRSCGPLGFTLAELCETQCNYRGTGNQATRREDQNSFTVQRKCRKYVSSPREGDCCDTVVNPGSGYKERGLEGVCSPQGVGRQTQHTTTASTQYREEDSKAADSREQRLRTDDMTDDTRSSQTKLPNDHTRQQTDPLPHADVFFENETTVTEKRFPQKADPLNWTASIPLR